MEVRKHSEWNLIPPTPPCMDCRRERVYWHCYRDCGKWLEYAEKYQAFVKERDELREVRR